MIQKVPIFIKITPQKSLRSTLSPHGPTTRPSTGEPIEPNVLVSTIVSNALRAEQGFTTRVHSRLHHYPTRSTGSLVVHSERPFSVEVTSTIRNTNWKHSGLFTWVQGQPVNPGPRLFSDPKWATVPPLTVSTHYGLTLSDVIQKGYCPCSLSKLSPPFPQKPEDHFTNSLLVSDSTDIPLHPLHGHGISTVLPFPSRKGSAGRILNPMSISNP